MKNFSSIAFLFALVSISILHPMEHSLYSLDSSSNPLPDSSQFLSHLHINVKQPPMILEKTSGINNNLINDLKDFIDSLPNNHHKKETPSILAAQLIPLMTGPTFATLVKQSNIHKTIGKNFPCTIPGCDKSFIHNNHLTIHMRTHNDEKLHTYSLRNKSSAPNNNLIRHIQTVHMVKKSYPCKICNKSFAQESHLIRHMCKHDEEEPNTCIDQIHAIKQMKINAPKKIHSCDICGKTLSTQYNLTIHMRIHTKEHPYTCLVCDRSFTQIGNFNKHVKICLQ